MSIEEPQSRLVGVPREVEHRDIAIGVARREQRVAAGAGPDAYRQLRPVVEVVGTTVRLFRTETTFILDVADNDPWVVRSSPTNPSRAGGLGLHLARKLSNDIGWYVSDGTEHVWAQVAIPMARRGAGDGAAQP